GSKLHLIKDCDFYNCVDSVPCKSTAASVPAGSRNSPASVTTGGSDPTASRNRSAVNSAGRPVSAVWLNPAARPYFRQSSVYFNIMYWPDLYDPMYMNKGRWGTAVKTPMAALQYKDDHNKIAYLGRERGCQDFTDILSYLDHSSLRYAL
ncbi:hypothetical protein Tco_0423344, partial [Tanacetum coccineum]